MKKKFSHPSIFSCNLSTRVYGNLINFLKSTKFYFCVNIQSKSAIRIIEKQKNKCNDIENIFSIFNYSDEQCYPTLSVIKQKKKKVLIPPFLYNK